MSSCPDPLSVFRRRSCSLVLLCAVQSCERFAFLAMLPLFVLYAQDRQGFPAPIALMVLSILQALSYLGGLPGGWLADRTLGVRLSTVLGAMFLTLAYGSLALDRASLFWPAMMLMVAGHSLFRPGLHVMIAHANAGDEQARERGFLWHYLAANIGYAAGALFGEWAHAAHGWPTLLAGASVVSLLSAGLLWLGMPRLRKEGADPDATCEHRDTASRNGNMAAVWLLCSVAVVFWLTAQQAGSSLSVFAAVNTERQFSLLSRSLPLGPGLFASLHGLMVIAMLPVFLYLHGRQRARGGSTVGKLIWGYVATSAAFTLMATASLHGGDESRVSGAWLMGCYMLLSLAEILLAPLGVSLVTRLAPQHKAARAVALWFAGSALGNGLAAALGLCWEHWAHHRYFAVLAALSLTAVVPLLARRRQLDWLTANSMGSSSRHAVESETRAMPSTSEPDRTLPGADAGVARAEGWLRLALLALPILIPGSIVANVVLPLPMRGACAILCGLAVLGCGPYLVGQALVRWAQPNRAPAA